MGIQTLVPRRLMPLFTSILALLSAGVLSLVVAFGVAALLLLAFGLVLRTPTLHDSPSQEKRTEIVRET